MVVVTGSAVVVVVEGPIVVVVLASLAAPAADWLRGLRSSRPGTYRGDVRFHKGAGCWVAGISIIAALISLPSASAAPLPLGQVTKIANGKTGTRVPWELKVSNPTIAHVPGLCVSFEWGGPNQPISNGPNGYNGGPSCITAGAGKVTSHGTEYVFNLAATYNGICPFGWSGNALSAVIVLAVPQARRADVRLESGDLLQLQLHPLPPKVDRPAAIGWAVTGQPHKNLSNYRSIVVFTSHGVVVGRWTAKNHGKGTGTKKSTVAR